MTLHRTGGHVLPLANFGSVTFAGASATNDAGTTGTITNGAWTYDAITLIQKGLTATPSSMLGTNGSGFTVNVATSTGGGGGGGHGGHGNPHGTR